jgi:hypothetical protein
VSGKYALYKNKSAVRFNLIPPKFNDKGYLSQEGGILVELSQGTGKDAQGNNAYNWEDKVMFSLGIPDIAMLMENPWAPMTHVHEKGGTTTTKVLQFQQLEPKNDGDVPKIWAGYRQKDEAGAEKKIGCALTRGEHRVFMELLKNSVPIILGWGHVADRR